MKFIASNQQCTIGFPQPANGNILYSTASNSAPFPSLTIATLICNLGFSALGNTSSTCINGVWTPSQLGECSALGNS